MPSLHHHKMVTHRAFLHHYSLITSSPKRQERGGNCAYVTSEKVIKDLIQIRVVMFMTKSVSEPHFQTISCPLNKVFVNGQRPLTGNTMRTLILRILDY